MGSKRVFLTAWTSPADPSLAATLEGHPLLLYHICHLCADVLDPPVHLQQHQPPSVRQGGPCEGETRLHSGPSRTQETNRFIGDGQTELQVEAWRCPRAGPTYSCGCRVTGHCAGAVTPPWPGVAAVTGSSAGGRCCSSLPSAPCGNKASGSGRGCFCTAECLKGLWLLGKEDRRPG